MLQHCISFIKFGKKMPSMYYRFEKKTKTKENAAASLLSRLSIYIISFIVKLMMRILSSH